MTRLYWRKAMLVAATGTLLAAGGQLAAAAPGKNKGRGQQTVSSNTTPSISGTPATTVVAGSTYSFIPTAGDADGNALGFSVSNKPAWAAFSTANGSLVGVPTALQQGTYGDIVITVTDGIAAKSLAAFSVTVTPPPDSGTALLSWAPPTSNTDDSVLTTLAGYKVHHGTAPTALSEIIDVPGAGSTSYQFTQLASGTHYFTVTAYTVAGLESAMAAMVSKTVP